MATNGRTWDYALRLRGVSPSTVRLARLGEYMKRYAELLGDVNETLFAGVVRGSAVLRARVSPARKSETHVRLLAAKAGTDGPSVKARDVLAELLARDGVTASLEDPSGAVILEFKRSAPKSQQAEQIVHDVGVIDGVVVGLVGIDDTVHLKLLTSEGDTPSITVRDLAAARRIAPHFRGDVLRVHVHGTWRRNADGKWEPWVLYLDRVEELTNEPAAELLTRLALLPGNRWSTMADPQQLLRAIRSDD